MNNGNGKGAAARLRSCEVAWRGRLEKALLRVERRRSIEERRELRPRAEVFLPTGPTSELQLLNLRVWATRYQVTPEFLIEALVKAYRRARRESRRPDQVALGLPASMISGPAARKVVEDAVVRAYPCGENRKSAALPLIAPAPPLRFDSDEEMLRAYAELMEKRRRELSRRSEYRRSFRRSGGRW